MNEPTLSPEQRSACPPFDLHGLQTYDLHSRPSKVFHTDLGQPVSGESTITNWISSLPRQLAGNNIRKACFHLQRAHSQQKPVVAAFGGHVIKTGCSPYLIDWIEKGLLSGIAMNGAAAIHDIELALAGKTSEDVGAQLPEGRFGMARETADAYAVAALRGMENETGLGWALGEFLATRHIAHPECSVLLAAYRAGIPCTVHVALGTDIVHMHPHVSGAALGEASILDFRRLCTLVSRMQEGVWLNLGSAVILPEVLLKAVSVVNNFGYSLDGFVTINVDKNSNYRSSVNVLQRPASEGIELVGHHEIMIPLLHAALAEHLQNSQLPTVEHSQAA